MASLFLLALLGSILATLVLRRQTPETRVIAAISFVLHVASAVGQYVLQEYYYGISDAHGYLEAGTALARLLSLDFATFAPEIVLLAFHLPTALPFEVFGEGLSTGTMSAIAGIHVFIFGESLIGAFMFASIWAWLGQLQIHAALVAYVSPSFRRNLLISTMLVPSVVFWGSAFAKETFVLGFLGILLRSSVRLVRGFSFLALIGVAVGVIGIGLLKPYILFPFTLGVAGWVFVARSGGASGPARIRPAYVIAAAVIAFGGIAVMGSIFPEFSTDRIAETTATQQELWKSAGGDSTLDIGGGEHRTILQQLPIVPLALVNALFRPQLFDARNAPAAGAAIENTVVAIMLLVGLLRAGLGRVFRLALRSPVFAFCVAFVPTFAVAVGLATANLGSLSRYRVPMVPFYVLAVLLLRNARTEETETEDSDEAPAVEASGPMSDADAVGE